MASKRANRILANRDTVFGDWLPKHAANPYDPRTNPKGIVNLCLSENRLCQDIVAKKITECLPKDVEFDWFNYEVSFCGSERLLEAICGVLNDFFNPYKPIQTDQVMAVAGATSAVSMVCIAVADPGDYFLGLTPYYFRVTSDLHDEAGINLYNVPMIEREHFKNANSYDAAQIEKYYLKATSEGLTVKGLFLINPDNPTGKVYTKKELMDILNICKKYDLHVIADEIYALTIYGEREFTSVISIKNLPDPDKTHFVWALSKDFCMNGYRCGVVYTKNVKVLKCIKMLGPFHLIPVQVQYLLADVLSDKQWIRDKYLPTNKQRLQQAYNTTKCVLEELSIPYYKGSGGFFIWADFSQFMKMQTTEEELKLFEEFASTGVILFPGSAFFAPVPGCLRIIFTVPPQHLKEGLNRIRVLCERILNPRLVTHL